MTELTNRKRANLPPVGTAGECFSGAFADPRRLRIRASETELITETCIASNIEHASKLHLQFGAHNNPSQNILEDTDSEGDYEPNERSSAGKESKIEQNEITIAAIIHCTPANNKKNISDSTIEDGDILPGRITHQNLTTEEAEKKSRSEANSESLENRRLR